MSEAVPLRARAQARAAPAPPRFIDGYESLAAALVILLAATIIGVVARFRPDTWLTLAAGRDIWHGGLPHSDTWTTLSHGRRWIDQQWLAHALAYGLWAVGGYALLALAAAGSTLGALAAMVRAARDRGASGRTLLVLCPVTIIPFLGLSWEVRAQAFAYPLFTAVFLLLSSDSRRPSTRVYLVLPVLALWANVHGSIIVGIALVVLYGLLVAPKDLRRAAPLLCAPLALLCTPYGLDTIAYYRETIFNPWLADVVSEWRPVTSDASSAVLYLVPAAFGLRSVVLNRGGATLWERVAFAALVVAGILAVRNVVWVALAAILVIAPSADVRFRPRHRRLSRIPVRVAATTGAAVLLAAAAVSFARPASWWEGRQSLGALKTVQLVRDRERSRPILADSTYWDWLLWRDPALRGHVVLDGRLELLSADGVRTLKRFLTRVESLPYRLVLLDPRTSAGLVARLGKESGARVLYRDRHGVVILRAAGAR